MPDKRWILLGDLHSGCPTSPAIEPESKIQREITDRYRDAIKHFGARPNVLVSNGDAIHGFMGKDKEAKSEILGYQAENAAELLAMWDAVDEYIIISGTGAHTAIDGEEAERAVCGHLERILRAKGNCKTKVTFCNKLKSTVNGWFRLEARHKIGKSTVPYSRYTAPNRYKVWQLISSAVNSMRSGGRVKIPHLCVFSHVHYYLFSKDSMGAVMVLPCWQAHGTKYGSEQCEGLIDVGCVQLTVGESEGQWDTEERLYPANMVSRWEKR